MTLEALNGKGGLPAPLRSRAVGTTLLDEADGENADAIEGESFDE